MDFLEIVEEVLTEIEKGNSQDIKELLNNRFDKQKQQEGKQLCFHLPYNPYEQIKKDIEMKTIFQNKNELIDFVNSAGKFREQLICNNTGSNPFPHIKDIENYLVAYQKLLVFICQMLLNEYTFPKDILMQIMYVDLVDNEKLLYSPQCLTFLYDVYYNLIAYQKLIENSPKNQTPIFHNEFLELISKYQFTSIQDEKNIYFPSFDNEHFSLKLDTKRESKPIDDITCVLKIVNKIEQDMNFKTSIVVIGSLDLKSIQFLDKNLEYLSKKYKKETHVKLTILGDVLVNYQSERLDVVSKKYENECDYPTKIQSLPQSNDSIFILDNNIFLNPYYRNAKDLITFLERININYHGRKAVLVAGKLNYISRILSGYLFDYSSNIGYPTFKMCLFHIKDFLEEVKKSNSNLDVIMYLEDVLLQNVDEQQDSMDNLRKIKREQDTVEMIWSSQNFKGVYEYRTDSKKLLFQNSSSNTITFNLIEIYKIFGNLIHMPVSWINDISFLYNTVIELDYSNWYHPTLSFMSKDQIKKYEFEKWIRESLFPLLQSLSTQINTSYRNVMNKRLQQLIYDNTHSLNDLIFYHQMYLKYFENRTTLIRNLELGKEKSSIYNYLGNILYQDRGVLCRYINILSSTGNPQLVSLKELIGLTDSSILERLMKSCEEVHYQNSCLYMNLNELKEKIKKY